MPKFVQVPRLLVMALLTRKCLGLYFKISSNEIYQSPRSKVWLGRIFWNKINNKFIHKLYFSLMLCLKYMLKGPWADCVAEQAMLQWIVKYLRPNNCKWDFINSRHLAPTLHIPTVHSSNPRGMCTWAAWQNSLAETGQPIHAITTPPVRGYGELGMEKERQEEDTQRGERESGGQEKVPSVYPATPSIWVKV